MTVIGIAVIVTVCGLFNSVGCDAQRLCLDAGRSELVDPTSTGERFEVE